MKSLRIALPLLLSFAATAAFAQISAQKSFDQLKSLAGSWEGKDSKGRPLGVSFRDTARGSVLMSEIQKKGSDAVMISMISMIHLDGPNRLLLTPTTAALATSPAWPPPLLPTAKPSPSISLTVLISPLATSGASSLPSSMLIIT